MPFFPQFSSLFVPPYIPPILDVSLLLHMNGANGSTTFTDSSLNNFTITRFGNAQISTAQFKYGGAAGYFGGNGDYLATPYSALLEPENFNLTCEMWVNTTNSTEYATLLSRVTSEFATGMWSLLMNSSGANGDVLLYVADYELGSPLLQSTGVSIRDGLWHHIAIVREGSSWNLYIDGISRSTNNWSGTIQPILDFSPFIGRDQYYDRYFTGYIDDLRITKGVARYTSNFTPPDAELPNP